MAFLKDLVLKVQSMSYFFYLSLTLSVVKAWMNRAIPITT